MVSGRSPAKARAGREGRFRHADPWRATLASARCAAILQTDAVLLRSTPRPANFPFAQASRRSNTWSRLTADGTGVALLARAIDDAAILKSLRLVRVRPT